MSQTIAPYQSLAEKRKEKNKYKAEKKRLKSNYNDNLHAHKMDRDIHQLTMSIANPQPYTPASVKSIRKSENRLKRSAQKLKEHKLKKPKKT